MYSIHVVTIICLMLMAHCDDTGYLPGYSFHKFSGPVNGNIKEVTVAGSQQHGLEQSVDYVAKPEYTYVYGVDDPYTGNSQAHQQTRDGDSVTGEYTVMEPDGTLRIVRYTADDVHGFQVQIEYVKPDAHTQAPS